ncbi:helix-turn-helix domain-containing protein [Prescottella equi]|uniref:helix-turn-helix domain-containing protein n=1 Tax=Rhodococcus hoagii TaxID=43767 RepID=UPI0007CD9736|nr:helix-turn-helix transcriptional regulator [Prescottella equi]
MNDIRAWVKSVTKRRITVEEIAEMIGVSRATATRYLQEGLSADHVIQIARACRINPADALVDLGYVSRDEMFEWLESDGKLLESASDAELALELAERLNPVSVVEERLAQIVDMHSRRQTLASAEQPKRRADLKNMRGAASRRVKEMYPEIPDEGL